MYSIYKFNIFQEKIRYYQTPNLVENKARKKTPEDYTIVVPL